MAASRTWPVPAEYAQPAPPSIPAGSAGLVLGGTADDPAGIPTDAGKVRKPVLRAELAAGA